MSPATWLLEDLPESWCLSPSLWGADRQGANSDAWGCREPTENQGNAVPHTDTRGSKGLCIQNKTKQNNHPENLHLLPKISEAQESLDGLISEDLSLFEDSP